MSGKRKTIAFFSDMHCGHKLGLTPPDWRGGGCDEIQKIGYDFILETVKDIKPDIIIGNGDYVDGPGHKGTRQHLETDMRLQQQIAINCFEDVRKANKNMKMFFTRGTPFHVETDQENEDAIADYFKSDIADNLKLDVNGLIINARHTASKGSTVYGSVTSTQRVNIVKYLTDTLDGNTPAAFNVNSHIHEFFYLDRGNFAILTTPAMQFAGSAYGRRLSSFYHFGVTWMVVDDENNYQVYKRLLNTKTGKKEKIIKC